MAKAGTYYSENKEKLSEYLKKYAKTEIGKQALERARKKERDNLTDNYIRQSIYIKLYLLGIKIVRKEITPEQIDTHRKLLIARRTLKLLKNEKQNSYKNRKKLC